MRFSWFQVPPLGIWAKLVLLMKESCITPLRCRSDRQCEIQTSVVIPIRHQCDGNFRDGKLFTFVCVWKCSSFLVGIFGCSSCGEFRPTINVPGSHSHIQLVWTRKRDRTSNPSVNSCVLCVMRFSAAATWEQSFRDAFTENNAKSQSCRFLDFLRELESCRIQWYCRSQKTKSRIKGGTCRIRCHCVGLWAGWATRRRVYKILSFARRRSFFWMLNFYGKPRSDKHLRRNAVFR